METKKFVEIIETNRLYLNFYQFQLISMSFNQFPVF